ncbi:MAG: hypothetical protein QXP27_04675 [Candidatus Methanomethyliaceae archaeon]
MGRKGLTLGVVLMLVLLVSARASVASAAGPTGTYATGISCVNLGNSTANIVINFYNTSGSVVGTINDTISVGGNVLYYTPSRSEIPNNFLGSAVVSSDQPVACSVNTQTSTGITRVGTSNGVDASKTGTKLFAPQILNNLQGFSSYVAVQNAGSASVNVIARYFNSSGAQVYSTTVSIPSNSSHVFYQDDGSLPSGFIGSATFESADGSTPLAGTVNFYNAGTASNNAQFHSYNTFTSGANKVYGPRVVKNLSGVGYTSGWSCQNLGPGSATITATVSFLNQSTNTTVTAILTKSGLNVGQAWAVYLGSTTGTALDAVSKGYGSVVMESSGGSIACIFNEDNRTTYAGQGSTYSGIPDGSQTTTIFFPQIVALGSSSYQGGFQIANTTSTDTICTYAFSNGTTVNNVPLAGNGSNSVFAPTYVSSFNGSVTVTCGQPIVGIYNLTIFGGAGDPFATNNGVNK